MPPTWLIVVAWCALAIAFASAGVILVDIFVRGYRQPMRVMEAVCPSPRCTSARWPVMVFVLFPSSPLHPTSPVYWFLMQIGMIPGFITSWPANVWLIRRGIKEAM